MAEDYIDRYDLKWRREMDKVLRSKIDAIHSCQEEILIAFIAKYKCQPDECEQIVQFLPGGGWSFYVRKRHVG